MPKVGNQTWVFPSRPAIRSTGTVAGKVESDGPFGPLFDVKLSDDRGNADTWEHAEQNMFQQAAMTALKKASVRDSEVDLMVGGDLNAQLTSFYFGLRDVGIPSFGVYSACTSLTQALAFGALCIETGFAKQVLAGTSSHNSTAERQFRYPTEYGAQRPPTSQRTVTGSGVALLSSIEGEVVISAATIGKVVDYGIKNPWEYGAAMAPAAEATIAAHLEDMGRSVSDYDCIATGDLGRMGHNILHELLHQRGIDPMKRLADCGVLIYHPDQPEVFSGGSGAACSSLVTLAHFVDKLARGEWKRILVSATGALLSAVTAQQGDSIPAISHAVVLERRG